jgi:hypothetical protein
MAGSVPLAAGPIVAGGSRRSAVGVVIVQQRSLSQFFGHRAQSTRDGEIERRSRQRSADISLAAKKSDFGFFHWIAPFRGGGTPFFVQSALFRLNAISTASVPSIAIFVREFSES